MASTTSAHIWRFYRIGGLDQVALETKEDLLNLDQLDQKLWVALSCPVKGLEIDEKTLDMIDSDKDGRIRVGELLAAVRWSSRCLVDVSSVLKGEEKLPLERISAETSEGAAILASSRQILSALGRADAAYITLDDAMSTAKVLASSKFNGDGIVPVGSAADEHTAQVLGEIMATQGADVDVGGDAGVGAVKFAQFFTELAAYASWYEKGLTAEVMPYGPATLTAAAAVRELQAKVDDFFVRCQLAAYDGRSSSLLNRSDADYAALAPKDLSAVKDFAAFPLAHVSAGAALPLVVGVNPAWSGAVAALREAALLRFPGLGDELTEAQWTELKASLVAHVAWQSAKQGASVEKLGIERVKAILASKAQQEITKLMEADKAIADRFAAITAVERLVRYHRDLRTLLANFVNFFDFYSRDRWAVFQAGTLFLDSRSTEFCIRVDTAHSLAAMSKAYIAYCTCSRPGGLTMNIAACFTQGDSDYLFVGRHGVFYDRAGKDWDAVITSIVDNPISIRQAFWSPYKKFIRMIEEQVAKRAAAAEAESHNRLASTAEGAANADRVRPVEPPKKLDLALITGIGVAIGSIGGFLAAVFTKFIELSLWKMPLVLLGLMFAISLPSMIIAWLKLRQRNLGPILESNGWAINGRVMINIPFGTALTEKAVLPQRALRSLRDPYEDESAKKARRITYVVAAVALVVYAALAYCFGVWPVEHGRYEKELHELAPRVFPLKEEKPVTTASAVSATPADAKGVVVTATGTAAAGTNAAAVEKK